VGDYTDASEGTDALIETGTFLNGTWNWNASTAPTTGLSPTPYPYQLQPWFLYISGIDLDGVSCASGTSCVATGRYPDSSGGLYGFIETGTLTNGSWNWTASETPATGLTPPAGSPPEMVLGGVSCVSMGFCAIAGAYNYDIGLDSATSSVGLIEIGTLPTPVAEPDRYYTAVNTTLAVAAPGVLGNDTLNGAAISSYTKPAHGTISLNPDGSFMYKPSRWFTGIDTFTYTLENASGNSTATVTIDVPARADLSSSLSAPPSTNKGGAFTYNATVTNNGPDPALRPTTFLYVPSGLSVTSSSPPAGHMLGLLAWSAGSIAPGASVTYSVTVQVTAKVGARLTAWAACVSDSFDPNLSNNFAIATTKVTS
jgi:hypothetical protein